VKTVRRCPAGKGLRGLLPYLTRDDKIVYFVTIPVLIELLWVLDAVYGCGREETVEALEGLFLLSTSRTS
jgi:predicted nucleic-acid-binding protein